MDTASNIGNTSGSAPQGGGDGQKSMSKRSKKAKNGPRINRFRMGLVLAGLVILATISTVFGMMMAVARELPSLESRNEYKAAKNSVVYDAQGRKIAELTGSTNRILVGPDKIAPVIKHAIVSIEDKRFYEHSGVDYRGIGRAIWADVRSGEPRQGASTIPQQFVKNALHAQKKRTIFQKLREASLAYNLERSWSKDKILTQYLNAAYFGNGAHGIEAAAQTYFGKTANSLTAPEAAMIAGLIASPSYYDPAKYPERTKNRRDLVLRYMKQEGFLEDADYRSSVRTALPSSKGINPPKEHSLAPYFTDYVKQQLVDEYGAGTAFGGGLKIRTSLDLKIQKRAEEAVQRHMAGLGPDAALVAINNRDGSVRAMVGGDDFEKRPFNLATNAQRQPGSAFKPFVYATGLMNGLTPNSTFISRPLTLANGEEIKNYEDSYLGAASMANGLVFSDNSVMVQVGMKVGTKKIARTAQQMGIETDISTNTAMIIGGLKKGVTTFQMAHAFSTFARNGKRITGSLAARRGGPVTVLEAKDNNGRTVDSNKTREIKVLPPSVAKETKAAMAGVVSRGTGRRAQVEGENISGKTGTTDDSTDAWFCGMNERLTVCVWVGYASRFKPMLSEFGGNAVEGGTLPAAIFASFMSSVVSDLEKSRKARDKDDPDDETGIDPTPQIQAPADKEDKKGSGESNRDTKKKSKKSKKKEPESPAEPTPTPPEEENTEPTPKPDQPEPAPPAEPEPGGEAAPDQM